MTDNDKLGLEIEVSSNTKKAEKGIDELLLKYKKQIKALREEFKKVGYSKDLERRLARVISKAKSDNIKLSGGTRLWNNLQTSKQEIVNIKKINKEEKAVTAQIDEQEKLRQKTLEDAKAYFEIDSQKREKLSLQAEKSAFVESEKQRNQTLKDAVAYYTNLEDAISKRKERQSLSLFAYDEKQEKANRRQMLEDAKAYYNDLFKKTSKQSNISKLFGTLKRVGFYRIARNFFKFFESGISEGIKALTNISPKANETLSKMSGNLTTIGNSLSLIILPVLEVAQPILQLITNTIARLAEGFSYLAYKLGITSSWFKINNEYMKDFNNQANKLSFDKFESLSGSDDSSSMLKEMTGDDKDGGASSYAIALTSILATLTAIEGLKFISWMRKDGLKKIKDGLYDIKTSITNISYATMILSATLGFVTSVVNLINLIKNWDSASLVSKITGITAVLVGLASVIMTILALTGVGSVKVMKAIATGLGAGAVLLAGVSALTIEKRANGGMVDSGSLFIAGEAGAELVTTMPSGQTGVTNIAQFKQAMLEALYEWGGSQSDGGDVVLNLDGAEIARSKRFVGEMNRNNSGLNLR